ncbi:MAG: hypothetical protein ACJ8GJ_02855, partial [Vitreoscilla sp.]
HWIEVRPNNSLTVLDTHDGIGIIDIGSDASDRDARPGLVPSGELTQVVEAIHANSRGQSRQATGAAASNLDLYQVNCTYYDALGRNDLAYLLARAIQLFLPGVPQIYYVGLLAGANDMALLERTGVGRDINRHHYQPGELDAELQRPVVRELLRLIRLRNESPAFAGWFKSLPTDGTGVDLMWTHEEHSARLSVDFLTLQYTLNFQSGTQAHPVVFDTANVRETQAFVVAHGRSPLINPGEEMTAPHTH